MHTLANSEDLDEMPNNAAFHQGLHSLLTQNRSSEKEIQFLFENYNLLPINIQWTLPSYGPLITTPKEFSKSFF